MKKAFLLFTIVAFAFSGNAQESEGSELGIDLNASGSNMGGTVGLGLKYGIKFQEIFIAGPSVRYQRSWTNNVVTGTQGGFNVFGGGGFVHARFYNAFFLGAECEVLSSPYNSFGQFSTLEKSWVPTLFLGGGFSMAMSEQFRLNIGVMYDVINKDNSPFRSAYFIQKKTSTGGNAGYLPIISRIAFFFPL